MDDPGYKTVWISTPPRTGSTWLFNVTREILRRAGRVVLPQRVPQEREDMFELARREAWTDTDPARIWVLKVHGTLFRPDLPRSKIITSLRDPRDVLVSFRRFMNTSFEHALRISEEIRKYPEAYRDFPPGMVMSVDYEDIKTHPRRLLREIGEFLGVGLAVGAEADIVAAYSRQRVRQMTEQTTADVMIRLRENAVVARDEVVLRDGAQVERVYDPATAFQTGHVSDYRDGDWRRLLTDEEKRQIAESFGDWFERNGFPAD